MVIGRIRHNGLKRLYLHDDPSGLPAASVRKIRNILAALESATAVSQLVTLPGWHLHSLKGDRRRTYAITVTGNWRITFSVTGGVVTGLTLEDYH